MCMNNQIVIILSYNWSVTSWHSWEQSMETWKCCEELVQVTSFFSNVSYKPFIKSSSVHACDGVW